MEEVREVAVVRSAKYQQSLRRYHAWHVQARVFQAGDFVLRLALTGFHQEVSPWEGTYIVTQLLRPGSYKLVTPDGSLISNMEYRAVASLLPLDPATCL